MLDYLLQQLYEASMITGFFTEIETETQNNSSKSLFTEPHRIIIV